MDTNDMELKELIYQSMNGVIIPEKIPKKLKHVIANEFESGKVCEEAYQHIYDANHRICERLHEQEDMDVECILANYSIITRNMCMKMYDYGSLFIQDENIEMLVRFYEALPDKSKNKFIAFINAMNKSLSH